MNRKILEVSSLHHAWKVYLILVTFFWLGVVIPNSITGIHFVILSQESLPRSPNAVSELAVVIFKDNVLSIGRGLIPIVGSVFAAGNVFLTGQQMQFYLVTRTMTLSDVAVRFGAFGWLEFVALAFLVTASLVFFGKFFVMNWGEMRLSIVPNPHMDRRELLRLALAVTCSFAIIALSAAIEAFLFFSRWIV